MRVVVTKAFRAYLNMQPEAFTEGQELKGSLAVYFMDVGADVKPADEEADAYLGSRSGRAETPPQSPADLDIEATAAEILAWVGEDPERAAEALDAELAKDKPRSTLVKQLEKLAGSDGE